MKMMQLTSQFLKPTTFRELVKEIDNVQFPWFYPESPGEPLQHVHLLFYDHKFSPHVTPKLNRIFQVACKQLNAIAILRIKVNATPRNAPEQGWHTDWQLSTPSKTCVLYLNDNDGYTEFKNGQKSYSISNNACIFDTNLEHRGVPATDVDRRFVVNINYFEK